MLIDILYSCAATILHLNCWAASSPLKMIE